jgi:hypothetical protein
MAVYPTRATFFADEIQVTVGSALHSPNHDSNQSYALIQRQTAPAANGDTFTHSFMLAAGTYTFVVVGYTDLNRCILDWYIDNVSIVTGQDWYSASGVYNVVKSNGSITVTGDGRHVLKGVVNGKNASSSGFFYTLTKYWLKPATDTTSTE